MFSRKQPLASIGRSVVLATIATLAVTLIEPPSAMAGAARPAVKQASSANLAGDTTDFSARRRYRHYRGGNPAAGLAIMGAMIGTIGAIAAHQHDDDYYYGPGYYAGPGYYYAPPPVYYAPRPYYYGPRVYRYSPY
jgi:hypothetical protein